MTRSLVYASSFLGFVIHASCAVNLGSSANLDNSDVNHFPTFSEMVENHLESLITSRLPSISDIAVMQEATEVKSQHLQQTTQAGSGAVAIAETFEAASLSGYLFDIIPAGSDCTHNFIRSVSTKLNTCVKSYPKGYQIIAATANMITTSNYSDSSCAKKIAVKAVPYTSGCVPKDQYGLARILVVAPTSAYPFPLSHLQFR